MAKNTSVSLGDHFSSFIDAQVRSGRYQSVSDVIRAGLRLLEDEEMKLASLRQALKDGEASGAPEEFNIENFISERKTSV